MPGCPSEETILALVEGGLPADKRPDLEAHLAACEECRILVSALARGSTPEPGLATTAPASSTDPRAALGPVRAGDVLAGKYTVERVLGIGGMGVVVAAMHRELAQRVALKFLLPAAFEAPGAQARFLREARSAARIQSEHVARVMDVGTLETGAPYLVMEYLDGSDLGAKLKEAGPLEPRLAIEYVLQACEAIAEAHALGIVHRDLKPANLFLTKRADGTPLVKVLDFGISKADGGSQGTLTTQSSMMGSPRYMSPEQLRSSRDVDARSDVWSLGVILFELVTGQAPFRGDSIVNVCAAIATDDPLPIRKVCPSAPEILERAVTGCLAKDPNVRIPSVAALARMLEPTATTAARSSIERIVRLGGETPAELPASASPFRKRLGIAAIAVAAAAAGFMLARSPRPTPQPLAEAPAATSTVPVGSPGPGRHADTSTSPEGTLVTSTSIVPEPVSDPSASSARPVSKPPRPKKKEPALSAAAPTLDAGAGPTAAAPPPDSQATIGQSGLLERK
jgi:serine/threonine-protein kinase